ncbi:MAG: GNAT family N-acetyltransferase [Bacteroidales bacterium]
MFELIQLKSANEPEFAPLMKLYTDAFPAEERRVIEDLAELIGSEERMCFNIVKFDNELAGLCVYWNFGDFYYLEHLAVYPEMRNNKIGQQVLNWLSENLKGLHILEVEPAEDEMAIRRINYYKRNGYDIRKKDYTQPSYDGIRNPIDLWIMTNEENERLEQYIDTIKEEVYHKNQKHR